MIINKMNSCKYGSKKGCNKTKYTQWNQILRSKPTFKTCPDKCIHYKRKRIGPIDRFIKTMLV